MRRISATRRLSTVATTPFFTITRPGPSLGYFAGATAGDAFHLTVQHEAFPRKISAADDATYAKLKPPAAGLLARIPTEELHKPEVWNPIRVALSEYTGAHRYPAAAMYSNDGGGWVTEYGYIKGTILGPGSTAGTFDVQQSGAAGAFYPCIPTKLLSTGTRIRVVRNPVVVVGTLAEEVALMWPEPVFADQVHVLVDGVRQPNRRAHLRIASLRRGEVAFVLGDGDSALRARCRVAHVGATHRALRSAAPPQPVTAFPLRRCHASPTRDTNRHCSSASSERARASCRRGATPSRRPSDALSGTSFWLRI